MGKDKTCYKAIPVAQMKKDDFFNLLDSDVNNTNGDK